MKNVNPKARGVLALAICLLASVAIAAGGFYRVPQDTLKIGSATSTNKTIEFDTGNGSSNPKITADGSTGLITFNGNGGLSPVGAVISFAGVTAPTGWLLCDGSAVSRTTYAALFAIIGTTYGVGNGTTTFNLPDLRGRAVAGRDDMGGAAASRLTNAGSGVTGTTLGSAGGAQTATGTIGGSQSVAHTHNIAHAHQWAFNDAGTFFLSQKSIDDSIASFASGAGAPSQDISTPATQLAFGSNYANLFSNSPGDSGAYYTAGVISPPTGSDGSTASSSTMSANDTVSGSNFTFTPGSNGNVQPTIVLNYLIKS